ncbi:unnamed protein product [Prorocentrum cordatum]|uniref:Carbohydrate kinase PfkB domain-containing protein n=1 Tax=Prorocentrum cordatum TaxID=2364126 RepID=A0ABN9ST81_9DINO|nr:unnamed protein product [Polarella glacialis]
MLRLRRLPCFFFVVFPSSAAAIISRPAREDVPCHPWSDACTLSVGGPGRTHPPPLSPSLTGAADLAATARPPTRARASPVAVVRRLAVAVLGRRRRRRRRRRIVDLPPLLLPSHLPLLLLQPPPSPPPPPPPPSPRPPPPPRLPPPPPPRCCLLLLLLLRLPAFSSSTAPATPPHSSPPHPYFLPHPPPLLLLLSPPQTSSSPSSSCFPLPPVILCAILFRLLRLLLLILPPPFPTPASPSPPLLVLLASSASSRRGPTTSGLAQVVRSVGGDELNVAIALAKIGWTDTAWASVLPSGPLGDIVRETARAAGVCLSHCEATEGEIGTYTVLPEECRVHFQRGHSCFALQREGLVDWPALLGARGAPTWLHLSGISPLVCPAAARCWAEGIETAAGQHLPVTLDLNHRPQLGTLEQLWAVVAPKVRHIHLMILAAASVRGLAALLGLDVDGDGAAAKRPRLADGEGANAALRPLLVSLHAALHGPALACCFKERDASGVQRRWSVVVDSSGVHSTEGTPVVHRPKDECGGGSAWAAGLIDGLAGRLRGAAPARASGGEVTLPAAVGELLRRADLLAAMCQESVGDHSTVTRPQLLLAERRWSGAMADLCAAAAEHEEGTAAAKRVSEALAQMERAKVVAILRAKNEARAVERAKELVNLGFRAVEVTCDSAGFEEGRLLPALALAVGDRCLVGVGTVTTLAQLQKADGGAGAYFFCKTLASLLAWTGGVGLMW